MAVIGSALVLLAGSVALGVSALLEHGRATEGALFRAPAGVLLLGLAASWPASARRRCRGWHSAARIALAIPLALLALSVSAELALRALERFRGAPLLAAVANPRQLPPGRDLRGQRVNELGFWGKHFEPSPRPGVLRVGVIGDELALSGDAVTNCFVQLERQMPALEVYNFSLPQAGPREYADLLRRQVLDYRPDLILVLLSVGNDITEQSAKPGSFEMRGLRLYQLAAAAGWTSAAGELSAELPAEASAANIDDPNRRRREFLAQAERQLLICRTPLDDRTRAKWEDACHELDAMLAAARERDVTVALVAAPTVYQVNASLGDQLRKRAGSTSEQLDLSLPQRRLSAFTAGRQMAWIDLLPALQSVSQAPFERNGFEFSPAGNQAVAETLRHWIEEHFRRSASPVAQAAR